MRPQSFLSKPISSYYLLLGSTAALTVLGLVMVLSASSIHSLETSGSSFAIVLRQFLFLILAVPLGFLASRLPLARWRSVAKYSLLGSVAILLVVQIPSVGHTVNGNRNWIGVGSAMIQPSEFAKFFMILWAGYILSKRERNGETHTNVIALLVPSFVVVMVLIMLGSDLGTTVVFAAILVGLLFVSGIPFRHIVFASIVGLAFVATMIVTVPNRMRRLLVVLHPFSPEYYKFTGWQPAHSIMGLASGGFSELVWVLVDRSGAISLRRTQILFFGDRRRVRTLWNVRSSSSLSCADFFNFSDCNSRARSHGPLHLCRDRMLDCGANSLKSRFSH